MNAMYEKFFELALEGLDDVDEVGLKSGYLIAALKAALKGDLETVQEQVIMAVCWNYAYGRHFGWANDPHLILIELKFDENGNFNGAVAEYRDERAEFTVEEVVKSFG